MKLEKKHYKIIFIVAFVIIVGVSVCFIFFNDDCDPNNKGYTKKGKLSDKCFGEAEDPKNITTPPPAGCKWTSDNTFPLKKCMSGNKVKVLQTTLGISADGKFGSQTESSLKAKTGKAEVATQEDYDKIVNAAPPPPPSGVKGAYAKYDNAVIRNKDLSENHKAQKDEWLGNVTDTVTINSQTYYELDGTYYVIKSFAYLIA